MVIKNRNFLNLKTFLASMQFMYSYKSSYMEFRGKGGQFESVGLVLSKLSSSLLLNLLNVSVRGWYPVVSRHSA